MFVGKGGNTHARTHARTVVAKGAKPNATLVHG
jgi:hypothetical protein